MNHEAETIDNREFKLGPKQQAWVDALRSGKYKQVKYYLKKLFDAETKEAGYCCLGVLCEINQLSSILGPYIQTEPLSRFYIGPDQTPITERDPDKNRNLVCDLLPWTMVRELEMNSSKGYIAISDGVKNEVLIYILDELTKANLSTIKENFLAKGNISEELIRSNLIKFELVITLADLNDMGVPFEIIANIIEKFPHFIFTEPV